MSLKCKILDSSSRMLYDPWTLPFEDRAVSGLCPSVRVSVCLSVCLSAYLCLFSRFCSSVFVFPCFCIRVSMSILAFPCVCIRVSVPVCMYVCMSVSWLIFFYFRFDFDVFYELNLRSAVADIEIIKEDVFNFTFYFFLSVEMLSRLRLLRGTDKPSELVIG